MFQSIASLFDGYGIIAMIIFAIGLIFVIVEIFVPGFGVFGILGSIFITMGVVIRFLLDFDINHLVTMVALVVIFVSLFAIIVFSSARRGMLSKSPLIENRTAIAKNHARDREEYIKILGKIGFAESRFLPAGKFKLDDEVYEAFSYGEFIEKGSKVQVVEVLGKTIYIKKVI